MSSQSFLKLDPAKLENVRERGGKTLAACPACRELGGDKSAQHLAIFPDGHFACAARQGDREHARDILRLAGREDWQQLQKQQPHPQFQPRGHAAGTHAQTAAAEPAHEPLNWPADCLRLANNSDTLQRAAEWRGLDPDYLLRLAEAGILGLHGGRLCFPVRAAAGHGSDVLGRQVFSWPEERTGDAAKADAWFSPAGVKPLPPLVLGAAIGRDRGDRGDPTDQSDPTDLPEPCNPPEAPNPPTDFFLFESQWDALAMLQAFEWDGGVRPQPYIVTRGTCPTEVLREALAGAQCVTLCMQNDAPKADGAIPAQQWRQRCLSLLPATVTEVWQMDPPPNYKDWNDALRGLEPSLLRVAISRAFQDLLRLPLPLSPASASAESDAATAQDHVTANDDSDPARPTTTTVSSAPPASGIHATLSSTPPPEVPIPGVWLEPRPLPSNLPPVPAFDAEKLLPKALRAYVIDCAERLQVDLSFIAVPLLVSLGTVLGNRLGLRPKMLDNWTEFPNLWGAIIGRPSTNKTAALNMGQSVLNHMETGTNIEFQSLMADHKKNSAASEITRAVAKRQAMAAAVKGQDFDAGPLVYGDQAPPDCRRFIVNDSTPEALHSILTQKINATGIMIFFDEICGLLCRLNDRERGAALRAFMLSGWSGSQPAVVDRIIRGQNLRVDRTCLSVLGGIQPGKLMPMVASALTESIEDDGWIQRFSMLVWPDVPDTYQLVDRAPDERAYQVLSALFEILENTAGKDFPGAEHDEARGEHYLRFTPEAAAVFKDWIEAETLHLRTHDIGAALESHFIKYRKTVCALSLLFHVSAEPTATAVSLQSLTRALDWIDYLKGHAHRVYGSSQSGSAETGLKILERIRGGELGMRFKGRDLKQRHWTGLTESKTVDAGLEILVEYGWLREEETCNPGSGRRTIEYIVHRSVLNASE